MTSSTSTGGLTREAFSAFGGVLLGGGVLRYLRGATCWWVLGEILAESDRSPIKKDTPTILSDTAAAQLLESYRVGGRAGLIREAVEPVLQVLTEADAAERIGRRPCSMAPRSVTRT